VISVIAAFIGYRLWGGWRGALKGVLILWLVYGVVMSAAYFGLMFLGPEIEMILSETGS